MFKKIAPAVAAVICSACQIFATPLTIGSTVAPSVLSGTGLTAVSPIISGLISPGVSLRPIRPQFTPTPITCSALAVSISCIL